MTKDYDLAGRVIGLAMKVHSGLGAGYVENVYENALEIELQEAGIRYSRQQPLVVDYRGHNVGEFRADFLVEDSLVVELKAVQTLNSAHEVQVVNYLSGTKKEEGLLLNFGTQKLEFKKKFRTFKPNSVHSVDGKPGRFRFAKSVAAVKKSAFSLIELLVAMAVLSLLVVMMLGLVDSATKLWRDSENRVDAYREARAALGIMSRDLRNVLATTNTNFFLLNEDGAFAKAPLGAETNTNSASAAFFLTALPVNAQEDGKNKSDICEVGYFLGFERLTGAENRTLNLYRFFVSSDDTFARLGGGSNFAGVPLAGARSELLARNIREFKVTPYAFSNNAYVPFVPSTNKAMPDLVELTVTAVNQDAAKRFTSKTDWTGLNPPDTLTNAQQTFTTRIRLNQP